MKMLFLRKMMLNMGPRAFTVLGPITYLRYLAKFAISLPRVLRMRGFLAVDCAMGSKPIRLRFGSRRFTIDCKRTDELITDGTFTFGIIRELVIRNCYLRHRIASVAGSASTVIDLGANRGVFSVMMATSAKLVIAVETLPEFVEAINANMRANNFTNYAIENSFIGEGGNFDNVKQATITMPQLLEKYNLDTVDLIKMDIEGSEFALFREAPWLDRVGAICMEVHPEWGDVQEILDELTRHRFLFDVTDHTFQPSIPSKAEFIYAVRQESLG